MLLCLPGLGAGLLADDHLHRARILSHRGELELPALLDAPVVDPTHELFVFFDGGGPANQLAVESGLLPWWAAPNIKAAFWRPLTALTHELDHAAWPEAFWAMHLHSLLWLGLAVALVAVLYRRILGLGAAAGLAALLFALEDAHAGPATWLANRNALIALCLGVVCLLLHRRWREGGGGHHLLLALVAFGAGLLSGELAVATGAYLFAYAVFLDPGEDRVRRLATLVPYGLVALPWFAAYRAQGFGTAGAQSYVDPISWDFPVALAERVPLLLASQWIQLPADPWIALPRWGQVAASGLGLLVTCGLVWALVPVLRARAEARFWALGMVLAVLPVCASFPMDRLLTFVGLGAMGLLALWAEHSGWLDDRPEPSAWRRRALGTLLVLHLALTPLLLPLRVVGTAVMFRTFEAAAKMLPYDEALAEQHLVVVNSTSVLVSYGIAVRALEGGVVPERVAVLAHMLCQLDVSRPDATSLVLRAEGGFLASPAEALLRSVDLAFVEGEVFDNGGIEVRVDEVLDDGRPAAITVTFPVPLEDPSLRWMYWKDQELLPFEVPAIGERLAVAPSFVPLGL